MFPAVTPPVGTKPTIGNGPASARSAPGPPIVAAGKNLTTRTPASSAAPISVAVTAPGITGTERSWQARTTLPLKPGVTMKPEPAAMARSAWFSLSTVPAPTSMSGSWLMIRIASSAASVRSVTSAHGRPPAFSASASGSACAAS